MENNEKTTLPVLIQNTVTGLDLKIAEIEVRVNRAVLAMEKLVSIDTDEQDEQAEALLVKVRTTYETVKKTRMDITVNMDSIKKQLMEPEKKISNEAGLVNEYSRIKKLRDDRANKKAEEERKRLKDIADKQLKETEKVKLKTGFESAVTFGIIKAVSDLSLNVRKAFDNVTIETIDGLAEKLSKGSSLKIEVYNAWFTTPYYNMNLVTAEEVEQTKKWVMDTEDFEKVSKAYAEEAKKELETWSDKIPAIRESLKKSKEEAAAAISLAAEQSARASAANTLEAQQKAKSNTDSQIMGVSFSAQIEQQTGAPVISGKSVKKAVINACNEDFIVTMSELFYAVFTHPKYAGVIKTDKQGIQQFNEDKTPVYVDWLDSMLSFYANNCSHKIPNISISESISTIQKKK